MLSATDHANIAAAVTAAEAKTSGEIFCIAAEEVSQYREIPLAWGAAFALVLPPLLLVAGVHPWTWAVQESQGWNAVPASAQTLISEAIGFYALAQTALFAVVALFVSIPEVRRALTPGFLKRHRVRRTAYAHFASTGLINAPNRTGVLIFASLKDRQVEIVADKAIHDEGRRSGVERGGQGACDGHEETGARLGLRAGHRGVRRSAGQTFPKHRPPREPLPRRGGGDLVSFEKVELHILGWCRSRRSDKLFCCKQLVCNRYFRRRGHPSSTYISWRACCEHIGARVLSFAFYLAWTGRWDSRSSPFPSSHIFHNSEWIAGEPMHCWSLFVTFIHGGRLVRRSYGLESV